MMFEWVGAGIDPLLSVMYWPCVLDRQRRSCCVA